MARGKSASSELSAPEPTFIYKFSARYFKTAYRLDLVAPESSDRLLLGPMCFRDKTRALEIASLIIGFDPNKQNSENPFWPQSATILLTCLLLHMAEANLYFTPRDIFTFLEVNRYNEAADTAEARDPLTFSLMNSIQAVREAYTPFTQLDGKTKSNVVISMVAALKDFMDPAVENLFSLPTDAERALRCRVIDPVLLRQCGTAIYVIVPEGRASQLANALGTIFGTLSNTLRRTGDPDDFRAFLNFHAPLYVPDEAKLDLLADAAAALQASGQGEMPALWQEALRQRGGLVNAEARRSTLQELTAQLPPALAGLLRDGCVAWYIQANKLAEVITNPGFCLMQFDEAGNVPLRNLAEDVGVGRGRRMPYNLGWQNKEQPAKQYGHDYANALMQSIGLKLFLPGLNSTTAHWVSELCGKATVWSHSSDDANDDRLDSERTSETGRDLVSESELRQLPAYTQAVFVMTDLPPVRLSFPGNAKTVDSQQAAVPCHRLPAYRPAPDIDEFITHLGGARPASGADVGAGNFAWPIQPLVDAADGTQTVISPPVWGTAPPLLLNTKAEQSAAIAGAGALNDYLARQWGHASMSPACYARLSQGAPAVLDEDETAWPAAAPALFTAASAPPGLAAVASLDSFFSLPEDAGAPPVFPAVTPARSKRGPSLR